MLKNTLALCLLFLIHGCTVTGPAQDQWDLEEKESKIDPNLFSLNAAGNTKQTNSMNHTAADTNLDPEYQEFLLYQEWKHEQAINSPAYQEFKAYVLWKKKVKAQ